MMPAGVSGACDTIGIGAIGGQDRVQLPDHANSLLPPARGEQLRRHPGQRHAPDIVQPQRPHPFFHKRRCFLLPKAQLRCPPDRIGVAVKALRDSVEVFVCAVLFRLIIRFHISVLIQRLNLPLQRIHQVCDRFLLRVQIGHILRRADR